jgi:adenine-specific DNA-methyltransferase
MNFVPTLSPPREAGVVYTKPWMVELVLDLAGYVPERPLARMLALEPSAGDGAFLGGMVRRLVESCRRQGIPIAGASGALNAFEIDPEASALAKEVVRSTLSLRAQILAHYPGARVEPMGSAFLL